MEEVLLEAEPLLHRDRLDAAQRGEVVEEAEHRNTRSIWTKKVEAEYWNQKTLWNQWFVGILLKTLSKAFSAKTTSNFAKIRIHKGPNTNKMNQRYFRYDGEGVIIMSP